MVSTPGVPPCVVRHGADPVDLKPGRAATFGRATSTDFSFPDEPRLSRVAGRLVLLDSGLLVTILSTSHGLELRTPQGCRWMPLATNGGPACSLLVLAGDTEITGPRWWTSSPFSLLISLPGPVPEEPMTPSHGDEKVTYRDLKLDIYTKEFMTALVLCRSRLVDEGPVTTPQVPAIADEIRKRTNSWHYSKRDQRRVEEHVQEHIKQLRSKLVRCRITSGGTKVSTELVASLLVASGTLSREHLRLFDDPDWLTWQEDRWWQQPP